MYGLNSRMNCRFKQTAKLRNSIFTRITRKTFCETNNTLASIKIILPNQKNADINFNANSTFKDIEQEIRKTGNYESVEFRTWHNSKISKANDTKPSFDHSDMIFLQIDRTEWQMLENPYIKSEQNNQDNFLDININVKHQLDEKEEIEQIYKVVKDQANKKNIKLSTQDLNMTSLTLHKIKNYYNSDLTPHLTNRSLTSIYEEYYQSKLTYAKMLHEKNDITRNAEILAKATLLLGGLFFVAQLGLLYYGTFILYTWDITEPITYLVGCSNLVLILYFRKKFGNLSALDYFKSTFAKRIARRRKFDDIKLEKTKTQITEIETFLN